MNNTIYQAINLCINKNIPFIAYLLPEEKDIVFFSNPTNKKNHSEQIFINTFANEQNDPIIINKELNAADTIKVYSNSNPFPNARIKPWCTNTDFDSYNKQISEIALRLKLEQGKTVLSKVLCGLSNNINWGLAFFQYIEQFPLTFRYIYFTHETGCWIGASPEILIDHKSGEQVFSTMALAGTRPIPKTSAQWDAKNVEEHDYVTNYIYNILSSLGLNVTIHPVENLKFGNIEHLCHRITSTFNNLSFLEILSKLSPTPALAGYPIRTALEDIRRHEKHPRYCYGGYIALKNESGFRAYVNFRGAHFDKETYCIYSGGGITAESNALAEWDEAESKIFKLKQILGNIS